MDEEADFTLLFQEHYESVLRYAWRRVGPSDAPDIANETFRIAWQKHRDIPPDRPLPWLYVTARNLIRNLVKKEQRREEVLAVHDAGDIGDHAVAVVARQAALTALNDLSESDRELVLLVAWEGLDLREAAQVAGCSRAAAAMRLHRARKRLEQSLADHPHHRPELGESAI
ncbi:RNA polymerase sigma factor [Nonomuraea gerenzanensis]|uniref:Putative RNA polymerase ECF-subfamily sigma factor n=1 Tax=Nonomuraea gerenzanensis TaxID=93944 RepID=A0A1M4DXA7_9ACTN|nr:sigma-70 family RNA polymerase sigma factor [Nonomuraea gerenzanensis]UBU13493.1 sigma-70 family RNA polymerase sigma factor [Nonomuraea gerenzanensis]SBO91154.1 Putative RNA polymerase ECF-subfamily sigma factor [Nonomuraea gerenzanensis]